MSSAEQRILRVNRSQTIEGSSPYALVSVTSAKGARQPLDLKLLATEGESAFVASIEHDRIAELKGKTNTADAAEWKAILSRTLLHTSLADCNLNAAAIDGLEIVFAVPNEETLIVTWQRRKRASAQILGSLSLAQTDDEQIDPFVWAGDAVDAADAAEDQVETLQQQLQQERAKAEKLKGQVESLVTAKEEHEQIMFSKFVELLNAKKLKIRDQQRMLAGATLNEEAIVHVTSSAGRDGTHSISKKRAAAVDHSSVDEDDDSDAFEDVSVKTNTESPLQSDIASEDGKEPTPPPTKPVVRRMIGGSAKKQAPNATTALSSAKKSTTKTLASSSKSSKSSHKADAAGEDGGGRSKRAEAAVTADQHEFDNQPPAKRRELPFQRKADPLPAPAPQPEPEPVQEPDSAPEAEPTPAVTRSRGKATDDAMDEDSDTEEEL